MHRVHQVWKGMPMLHLPRWAIVLVIALLVVLLSIPGNAVTPVVPETQKPPIVARMWHGRTPAAKAEAYSTYLYEAGIKKIRAIEGNLGVQTLRRVNQNVAEFYVISYWRSREAIRQFAGADIEKTHNLPRDPEFLLELEPQVKHFDLLVNEWPQPNASSALPTQIQPQLGLP